MTRTMMPSLTLVALLPPRVAPAQSLGTAFPNPDGAIWLRLHGAITELARFEGAVPGLGLSVSPDGKWLLYSLYEVESDLMLVENFR